MAGEGPAARGEQSGDDPAPVRDGLVADGVDTAVDRDEAAGSDTTVDLVGSEPQGGQLSAADNPALTGGEPRDGAFDAVNVGREYFVLRAHDVDRE